MPDPLSSYKESLSIDCFRPIRSYLTTIIMTTLHYLYWLNLCCYSKRQETLFTPFLKFYSVIINEEPWRKQKRFVENQKKWSSMWKNVAAMNDFNKETWAIAYAWISRSEKCNALFYSIASWRPGSTGVIPSLDPPAYGFQFRLFRALPYFRFFFAPRPLLQLGASCNN